MNVAGAAALGISLLTATVMIAGIGSAHPADVVAGVILTGLVAVPPAWPSAPCSPASSKRC